MESNTTAQVDVEDICLPGYFPTFKADCKNDALIFFACFTEKGAKTQKGVC